MGCTPSKQGALSFDLYSGLQKNFHLHFSEETLCPQNLGIQCTTKYETAYMTFSLSHCVSHNCTAFFANDTVYQAVTGEDKGFHHCFRWVFLSNPLKVSGFPTVFIQVLPLVSQSSPDKTSLSLLFLWKGMFHFKSNLTHRQKQ